MKEELELELQILNYCNDYISSMLDKEINVLTDKALSLKMKEIDRLVILGGRETLMNLKTILNDKRQNLLAQKQKER